MLYLLIIFSCLLLFHLGVHCSIWTDAHVASRPLSLCCGEAALFPFDIRLLLPKHSLMTNILGVRLEKLLCQVQDLW